MSAVEDQYAQLELHMNATVSICPECLFQCFYLSKPPVPIPQSVQNACSNTSICQKRLFQYLNLSKTPVPIPQFVNMSICQSTYQWYGAMFHIFHLSRLRGEIFKCTFPLRETPTRSTCAWIFHAYINPIYILLLKHASFCTFILCIHFSLSTPGRETLISEMGAC